MNKQFFLQYEFMFSHRRQNLVIITGHTTTLEKAMFENISLPTNVLYIEIHRKNPMNPQCGCILTNGYVNCTDRFFPTASNNGFSQLYSIYTAPLSLSDTLLCTAKSIHLCTHSFSYLNLFLTNLSRSLVYSPLHLCEKKFNKTLFEIRIIHKTLDNSLFISNY